MRILRLLTFCFAVSVLPAHAMPFQPAATAKEGLERAFANTGRAENIATTVSEDRRMGSIKSFLFFKEEDVPQLCPAQDQEQCDENTHDKREGDEHVVSVKPNESDVQDML